MAAYTKSQPLGRFGSVRDIADATVYLFSNTGSYVTGQTLVGKCLPRGILGVGSCSPVLTPCSGRRKLAHVVRWYDRAHELSRFPIDRRCRAERQGAEEVEALIHSFSFPFLQWFCALAVVLLVSFDR